MDMLNPSGLTDEQELLLSAFIDGECTSVERVRAQQLLKQNENARNFVDAIGHIANHAKTENSRLGFSSSSLWDRVAVRLAEEERTEILIGKRNVFEDETVRVAAQRDQQSLWESFTSWVDRRVMWGGLSGAVATAGVLLFVQANDRFGSGEQQISPIASSKPVEVTQVSLGNESAQRRRPTILADRSSPALEVDWARGNGPLKFIQSPEDRSAIIWVRRRTSTAKRPVDSRALVPSAITSLPAVPLQ